MEESIIVICLLITATFIKIKYRLVLYHSEKERILTSIIIFIIMISWELVSTRTAVWLYPGPGLIGVFVLGLPIELYLFYLVLPYFVFIVFELIHKKLDKKIKKTER